MINKLSFNLLNFFKQGHKRTIILKKNIALIFLLKIGSVAVTFLLVPITINYVEPIQYGIWLTLSSIVAWFGIFDIGLGNGLRNKLAEAITNGEHKLARTYISTTYAILSLSIITFLLLFFLINPYLNWSKILNAPLSMSNELNRLAVIVFFFFCIQFILQLLITVTTANQQPAKASIFNFVGSLISLIIIVILTKTTSGNLIILATVLGVTPVLVLSYFSKKLYSNEYKQYAPAFKYVDFSVARNLMNLGLKFFIIQVAVIILYQTNSIIIAQLLGPAHVTAFNIAFKYFSLIPMVLGIIIYPYWSAFTEAWVKNDVIWIRKSMYNLKLLWGFLSLATLLMLLVSGFVYRLWVGNEIVISYGISVSLAIYFVINAWNNIYSHFLNGVGKIKLQFYSAIWGSLINIPLAIYLGKMYGVPGIILSSIFLGVINMVWSRIQYNKIISNKAKGIWDK
jgi:O-antigen/teichoic acid export membrane protein